MIDHVTGPTAPTANTIIEGDCIEVMARWPDACVDHCIADPPFGIASGGGRGGKGKGLGWAFSSHVTMHEAWDSFSQDEFFQFNVRWLTEVCRVVKPNGNLLVFGTFHNIYQLGFILQNVLNRRVLNSIIWFKPNAQPNITARTLTESTEQIIWAVNETPKRARKWTFNYDLAKELAGGRQMRNLWNGEALNVWAIPVAPPSERQAGKHPAQKPLALTDRLVLMASRQGDTLLDPFAGTGGAGVSAARYLRQYVLIEHSRSYLDTAGRRLNHLMEGLDGHILKAAEGKGMSLNDAELFILRTVKVPQADNLDHVFEVPKLVNEGHDTRAAIAKCFDYEPRQGPYYAGAAMAVRLIAARMQRGADRTETLYVTPIGRGYLDAQPEQQMARRRYIVLNSPFFKYIGAELGVTQDGAAVPWPPPQEMLDANRVAEVIEHFDLSGDTPQRRAGTLCGWLRRL
jgi:site-specific DNA-methyltransferase (adenine-specific)